jgi:L,D-transpeptidase YcbB
MKNRFLLLIFFLSCFLVSCRTEQVTDTNSLQEKEQQFLIDLNDRFSQILSQELKSDSLHLLVKMIEIHSENPFPWMSDQKVLNENAHFFLAQVSNALCYGLDSSQYDIERMQQLETELIADTANMDLLVESNYLFTKNYLVFASQLKYGLFNHQDKDSLYFEWKLDSLSAEDLTELKNGLYHNDLPSTIEKMEPQFVQYKQLRNAWANYMEGKKFGKQKIQVHSLKEDSAKAYQNATIALVNFQYLDSAQSSNDSLLQLALIQFQHDNNLASDGRIGSATAFALSQSNYERKLAVISSLEKYKWEKFEEDSLLYVNIPSYELKVIEKNKVAKIFRAVVGKTINQTPSFSANMDYLILNPYWHIPRSISSKEILPKLKKDSNLVNKKGYTIYDSKRNVVDASTVDWGKVSESSFNYRISQTRSGATALGRVKFIFTNEYSIYMHDTPSKSLFKNDVRAYSHGCVRLENPLELATYLISRNDANFTQDSVENFVKTGQQKKYNLNYPLLVSLRYFSCEGSEDGTMRFYRDIYKKETHIKSAVEKLFYSKSE